jgi:hypothetical protein
MRRPMGPLVLAVLLLMGNVLIVGPLWAAAQEFPIMPDPAACRVDPRPTDEVLSLWYDTAGNPIGPAATPSVGTAATLLTIPVGPSADEATIEAITTAVTDLFACFAAGDFPRALALMTDKLAQSLSPGVGASIDDARAFLEAPSEPEPAGEGPAILAVTDVMLLADGRVGAFVVIQENGVGDVAYLVFAPDGEWWLWDEDVHFAP